MVERRPKNKVHFGDRNMEINQMQVWQPRHEQDNGLHRHLGSRKECTLRCNLFSCPIAVSSIIRYIWCLLAGLMESLQVHLSPINLFIRVP